MMTYRCRKHPRYKGARFPNNSCPGCWYLVFKMGIRSETAVIYAFNTYIEAKLIKRKANP